MCGILGFFRKKGQTPEHWDKNVIFDTILHWRRKGTDGMGMLVISDKDWYTRKAKVNQSEFIAAYGEEISEIIDDPSTRAIIFHNRWATHGAVTDDGCHPFVGERYILIHNGSVNPKLIEQVNSWEYKADSDTERMCARLNRPEIREQEAKRAIKFMASKIYNDAGSLGILVIYDIEEDYLYILRTSERELVYNVKKNCITRFWNDHNLAKRFETELKVLPHGTLIQVDPNDGEIRETIANVVGPVKVNNKTVWGEKYFKSGQDFYEVKRPLPSPTKEISIPKNDDQKLLPYYGGVEVKRYPTPAKKKDVVTPVIEIKPSNQVIVRRRGTNVKVINDPFVVDENPSAEKVNVCIK